MRSVLSAFTRHRLTTVVAGLLILGAASSISAQRGAAWEHLGTKEIEGKADHDKIEGATATRRPVRSSFA